MVPLTSLTVNLYLVLELSGGGGFKMEINLDEMEIGRDKFHAFSQKSYLLLEARSTSLDFDALCFKIQCPFA